MHKFLGGWRYSGCDYSGDAVESCPFGQPGDLLYVRETWQEFMPGHVAYRASCENDELDIAVVGGIQRIGIEKWRPSIHMPKWACRLWLRVTGVRVERLQEISEKDAEAKGISRCDGSCEGGCVGWHVGHDGVHNPHARAAFLRLWNTLYAKRGCGWDTNPWVWVVTFERCEAPE